MQEKELQQLIRKHNPQVAQLRAEAIAGDTHLLNTFLTALSKMLDTPAHHPHAYNQINELAISAEPNVIAELNNEIFPIVAKKHVHSDLDGHIAFWKRMYSGGGTRIDYPNVAQTLSPIKITYRDKGKDFDADEIRLTNNIAAHQQKRIEFFEDLDGDSFLSDSVDGDTMLDIIEMDTQQIKEIRKIVESGPIDEIRAEEFLKKMKNFLAIKPRTLSRQLNEDFNNQRIWAKQYVDCYKDYYMSKGSLSFQQRLSSGAKSQQINLGIPQMETAHIEINNKNDKSLASVNVKSNDSYANIPFQSGQEEVVFQQDQPRRTYDSKRKVLPVAIPKKLDKKTTSIETAKFIGVDAIKSGKSIVQSQQKEETSRQNIQINNDDYPIAQSQFQIPKTNKDVPTLGMYKSKPEPKFLLDTSELRKELPIEFGVQSNASDFSSRKKPRIFKNQSPGERKMIREQQPNQDDLVVVKHRATQNPYSPKINVYPTHEKDQMKFRHTTGNQPNRGLADSPQFLLGDHMTPVNIKGGFGSPGTPLAASNAAFGSRTLYGTTSSKKLSQFTQQKKQRKLIAPIQKLSHVEYYVLKPYSQHFDDVASFGRFKRNCLEDNFTLYASSFILVSCVIQRQSDSRLKVDVLYENQSHNNLAVETLYRIPRCFKIEKYSKVSKKFILKDQVQHTFALQLTLFPLEACILNLKYTLDHGAESLRDQVPTPIVMPITMRNFLQYLILGEQQWMKLWGKWSQGGNFSITKHILLDRLVVSQDSLDLALQQFVQIPGIEGYSVQQYGAFCRHHTFNDLKFLLRISNRVDSLMSIQIVTDRPVKDPDETGFLQYCIDVWSMLLSKVMDVSEL